MGLEKCGEGEEGNKESTGQREDMGLGVLN